MKVRFASSTGCPHGQMVIEAETEQDRAILEMFLWPHGREDARKEWRFGIHGQSWTGGLDGVVSFNFGWFKRDE